jgi:ubiquinone/menaquinone biosynthesis C-methylase UbiE
VGDSLLGRRAISHREYVFLLAYPFIIQIMESYLYDDLYQLEETHWWHRNKRELVISLLSHFFPKKKIRIVDVGCGTGKNVETFSKFGTCWGLDMAGKAIAFCKKRGLSHIKKGTAEQTGLPEQYFDVVTLLDVLEHTDDKKTLMEMRLILQRGGLLIITVPAYMWMWSRWDTVLHHKRRYGKHDLEKVLEDTGFRIKIRSFVYAFLLFPVLLIRFIKSRNAKEEYGSDFQLSNPFLDTVLFTLCRIEAWFVIRGLLPFGTSILVVAEKI